MARERKKPEPDNELRWLTTYGDVVTLLLAFFVMLYAISQVDETKFQLFVTGLAEPFGNPAVSEGLLGGGTGFVGSSFDPGTAGEGSLDGSALLDGRPQLEEDIAEETQDEPPVEEVPEEVVLLGLEVLSTVEQLEEVREALTDVLDEAGFGDISDFELTSRGLTVAISTDRVLFASGSASFGEKGKEIIGAIAPVLSSFSNEILVEGHTDSVPLLRAGYDNWNLSSDRALAVLKLLTDTYDLDPGRLAASGYGEYRPRSTNDTSEGNAINRRVELVIVTERGDDNG